MRHPWMVLAGLVVGLWSANGWAETAKAVIEPTNETSPVDGTATLNDTPEGLAVAITVSGLAPGRYAMHIHQYGECGDAGNAAGGHYNPRNVEHGFLPDDGLGKAHPGDLGNIDIGRDGTGTLVIVLPGVSLGGPLNVGGRAVVLHERVDDFSQPTGNAGGRVGCGPIPLVKD